MLIYLPTKQKVVLGCVTVALNETVEPPPEGLPLTCSYTFHTHTQTRLTFSTFPQTLMGKVCVSVLLVVSGNRGAVGSCSSNS